MFVLPDYFMQDVLKLQKTLDDANDDGSLSGQFLYLNLDKVEVLWDDKVVAGELRYDEDIDGYRFFVNEETLKSMTEGIS